MDLREEEQLILELPMPPKTAIGRPPKRPSLRVDQMTLGVNESDNALICRVTPCGSHEDHVEVEHQLRTVRVELNRTQKLSRRFGGCSFT